MATVIKEKEKAMRNQERVGTVSLQVMSQWDFEAKLGMMDEQVEFAKEELMVAINHQDAYSSEDVAERRKVLKEREEEYARFATGYEMFRD